jgi:hypothetical protein
MRTLQEKYPKLEGLTCVAMQSYPYGFIVYTLKENATPLGNFTHIFRPRLRLDRRPASRTFTDKSSFNAHYTYYYNYYLQKMTTSCKTRRRYRLKSGKLSIPIYFLMTQIPNTNA